MLLVEDSAEYASYLIDALSLSEASYRITSSGSLREAIARLGEGVVDVVLLDLNLPDSSGLGTLHRLQSVASSIPVVILSGVLDRQLAVAAVQAGAQDYLVKSEIGPGVISRVIRYAIERRAVEARLRERDAHYRSIIESSFDAVVSIDASGVTEFNPKAEQIFGRRREDVIGKDLSALIVPERMRAAHREGLRRQLADPDAALTRHRFEFLGLRADGSEFPLELTLSKQPMTRGAVVTAFIRDISEQRRAADAKRISDERFSLLSAATHDVIWDWNLVTGALWWNDNFPVVFGYPAEEVEPTIESWTSRIHPADSQRVSRLVEQLFADGGTQFWAEYRFRRKSGDYAYVLDRGQVIRDETGRPVRMVGGMADMTERHRAESRIAEQASLLDQARDAILVRDLEHRVTYFNKSAERLYGWTANDVLGESVRERFFPDPAIFDDAMRTLLQHGGWQGEVCVAGRDGIRLTVESRWTLMRDAAGAPCSVLVIDTDISERKELERRFLRAQRMESIGTLAGGIAHDLNNMLAPVLMSIELLKETESADERNLILATVEASTRRGAEMVRQVLSFARGVEGDRAPVDVAGLLREVERFANDTFMKSIRVRADAIGPVTVLGDATQLQQVLINLCVNARDAMPQGGTLSLAASGERVEAGRSDIDPAMPAGDHVVIRVTDTGTGIQPAVLDRIFEPFFTSKPTGKGTGLGLSTSLAIVKSHGGVIRADTTVGSGSTFTIYLPALAERPGLAAAPAGRAPKRGAGELILIVDDEAAVLRMTMLVLESFGYRVLATGSGDEAVRIFEQHRGQIKVLFTDMTMPGMDGATLIRNVREIDPGVRVIAASGLGATEAAKVSGVMRFLAKPYTADSVLKAVTDAIHG